MDPSHPRTIIDSTLSRRTLLWSAALAGLGGTLAACGGGSQTAAPAQPGRTSFAGSTVRVATLDGELGGGVKAQQAALKAATGIDVQLSVFPQSELRQKISADVVGAKSFDVVIEPFTWLHELSVNGQIVVLDQFIAADRTIDVADFIPALYEGYGRWDGKQYTLPYKPDAQLFFYRKDLFADPQVKAAFRQRTGKDLKVPETTDELVETAAFFTRSGNPDSPTRYGWSSWGEQIGSFWSWAIRLGAFGGDYVEDGTNRPTVDSDAGRRAMGVCERLLASSPKDVGSYEWEKMNQSFLSGDVAMIEQWPGLAPLAEATDGTSKVGGKVGYAVPPGAMVDGSLRRSSILGGWAAAVTEGAKDKDAAYAAIAFLTGKQGEPLKVASGNAPTRTSVYAKTPAEGANAYFPVLAECLAVARVNADVDVPPISSELQDTLRTTLNSVWTGGLSGTAALAQVQGRWTGALKEAGLLK